MQPVPEPTQPEVIEPEIHSLSWYTDQVWAEHKRIEEAQDIIAGCMAFNGFEYEPEVAVDDEDLSPGESEQVDLESAETQGYGIVADFLADQSDEELVLTGPNADYFEELDTATQEAYLEALDGTQENGFEGCRSEAQLFTMNTDPSRVYQDSEFRDLIRALGALPDTVAADERMTVLEDTWRACMSVQGLPEVERRAAMPEMLREEFEALEHTEESLDRFLTREITIATADVTCAAEADWAETVELIETDHHEQFVEEHREDLEALVDEYGM